MCPAPATAKGAGPRPQRLPQPLPQSPPVQLTEVAHADRERDPEEGVHGAHAGAERVGPRSHVFSAEGLSLSLSIYEEHFNFNLDL